MKEKWEALRKKYWPPGKDQFLIMALCEQIIKEKYSNTWKT